MMVLEQQSEKYYKTDNVCDAAHQQKKQMPTQLQGHMEGI